MNQPDLFDKSRKTEAISIVSCGDDYRAEFREWIKKNWFIYLAFERRALRAVRVGFHHAGAKAIVENIRWQSGLAERDSEFKINNIFTSDLARLFEAMNPDHEGFFRQRIRKVA